MAFTTTPLAGSFQQESTIPWPMLIEAALVIAAIAALLPWFAIVGAQQSGRGGRFAAAVVAVRGFPQPVLPKLCASVGMHAEPLVRERLCAGTAASGEAERIDRMPRALHSARVQVKQAFLAPLRDAELRLAELRHREREGLGDPLAIGDAMASTEAEIQAYLTRYRIDGTDGEGPLALACAFAQVEGALAEAPRASPRSPDTRRANAVMLLGAALDGHPATPMLASAAALPRTRAALLRGCAGVEMADGLAAASTVMTEARATPASGAKNEAMRALLRTAGWQWAGWALAGLALMHLSRRAGLAAAGIALALAVFAAAAWLGRVPWPLGSGHAFVLGRESTSLLAAPAGFVLWLAAGAVVVTAASPWLSRVLATGPQQMASALGYPGLVFATGVGWLLLLDLSANGPPGNRYLALYHQGHLWLGMLALCVVAFVRQPVGRALSWTLSLVDGLASSVGRRFGVAGGAALLVALMLVMIGIIGALLLNVRQLTSEIGRLWLIIGAAWFFFLRGTPMTERFARSGNSLVSLVRYVWPLLFIVAVLVGTMIITHDMGPLMIAGYGAGAFVAASVAMWWYQRGGAAGAAFFLAVVLFIAWILATTGALFRVGALDEVGAARLENAAAPLASANDQLALVTWFQRAAPEVGFGPGSVPWCGFGAAGTCAGVPAQIQSDYTFTALVGEFGWAAAWAVTLGCATWLHLLIRRHGRATRGEPRFVRVGGRIGNDDQAFVSWLCVMWVVLALCQLAITVAGNLAVIPLTGVTFPFVSFGMTSLLVNMAMVGLAINVNGQREREHG